jgi:hypothetical protein
VHREGSPEPGTHRPCLPTRDPKGGYGPPCRVGDFGQRGGLTHVQQHDMIDGPVEAGRVLVIMRPCKWGRFVHRRGFNSPLVGVGDIPGVQVLRHESPGAIWRIHNRAWCGKRYRRDENDGFTLLTRVPSGPWTVCGPRKTSQAVRQRRGDVVVTLTASVLDQAEEERPREHEPS